MESITKPRRDEAIAVSLQQSSLFGDSHHQLKFGKALKKVTKDDLKEEDISDMLSAQKAFERFGFCHCGACACFLNALWKIRLLLFNIIGLAIGWSVSTYLITDETLADDVWFYIIYIFFLILAISITRLIFVKIAMSILVKITKNTWKVFYVKNVRNRLYMAILSTLWVVGFYYFGIMWEGDSHEHPTMYRFLLCLCISSVAFLMTHILIRYAALHSYFEIFKVRARKIKTFITMIELMLGSKGLFSLPIMNFLIDFPSAEDHRNCKKYHKSSVDFNLMRKGDEMAEEIAEAMKHSIFDLKGHDDMDAEELAGKIQKEAPPKRTTRVMFATDADKKAPEEEEKGDSLSNWLEEQNLSTMDHKNVQKALNALNILSVKDLEEILVDLYQTTHRHEFRETFVDKGWMTQLQNDMLSQGMSYSEWIKFRSKTYDYFVPKIKLLMNTETEKQVQSHAKHVKRPTLFKAMSRSSTGSILDGDMKDVDEILHLDHRLYSIRLSGGTESVHLISDRDLNKLTRMLSYLIMIRLNQEKQKILRELEKRKSMGNAQEVVNPSSGSPGLNVNLKKLKDIPSIGQQNLFADKSLLALEDYRDNQRINKQLFIKIFQNMRGNSGLLENLGEFAWKKFGPSSNLEIYGSMDDEDVDNPHNDLDVMNLNGHISNVIHDLLLLKKTVDSYTIIITNVQRMVDVITPLVLLFVYLNVFGFGFEDTLGLYISVVGVIAFFGQSYFSSVFASISFVMALNPFLVGDYIMYKGNVYLVKEISLISCTFKLLKLGSLFTFQNEQLSSSDEPIVNLSRSELTKTKYRWVVYMKSSVSNQDLDRYKKRVKELITHHKATKNENFRSIKVRADDAMEDFTKVKIKIQMRYDRYNSDVNSVGFVCCTKAMTEMNLHWEPLPISIHLKSQ